MNLPRFPWARTLLRPRTCCALLAIALAHPVMARDLAPIDALRTVAPAAVTPALAALKRAAPSLQTDARLGVPTFVWGRDAVPALRSTRGSLTAKSGLGVVETARAHLTDFADVYRISAIEIAVLPVRDRQRFPNGSELVRFDGQVDGIEVFREQAGVLVDADGALVAISGFVMGADGGIGKRVSEAFALDAAQAAGAALADYGFAAKSGGKLQAAGSAGGYALSDWPAVATGADGATLAAPVRSKRVWFRLGTALVPAWYVEVQVSDGAAREQIDYYAYVIAADDGRVLFRHNQTADAAYSYRVYAEPDGANLPLPGPQGRNGFPHPTGTADGYQAPQVAPNLITLQNAPFSRNDPWLPDGATRTIGNNAEAYLNIVEPDGFGTADPNECNLSLPVTGDTHACTNSGSSFDYVYDTAQPPNASRTQAMAAVTNLFYMNNYLHDWFYDVGFDEAAGNAQDSNYGRGGLAGDPILAQGLDYSGTNNASMATPADGGRPRMRMHLWTSSTALARVVAPAPIAGSKGAGTAAFGPQAFDVSGDLVLAQDEANTSGPATTDGCTPFTNAAAVAGKIAAIDRGECTFVVKVKNAQNAGAVAVLILNNAGGGISMAGDDPTITIPVLAVSLIDGIAIKGQLAIPATVTVRLARLVSVPRDGALDNSLIAHEWGHYISNRLVRNANGLVATQSRGLGEGFADFHALLLLVKEADRTLPANAAFGGTYAETAYAQSGPDFGPDAPNNAYYFGIRRYPYSRDMTKNPLTFKHITDGVALPAAPARSPTNGSALNAEVHNTGEVWASMLWECYSNLLNDTARLTFAQAQNRMKRYLVGGYKMTPSDPTFIGARDALLAVMLAQDPQDHALCLAGFAKRGAGVGAVAPGIYAEDNAGVIESFSVTTPPAVKRAAVEYYHAAFDHYFITDLPDEITKLDNGTFTGWARTGAAFNVYTGIPPAGAATVCRFFSTAFDPKSSHFYTPDAPECGVVKAKPEWQFEGDVFALPVPDITGTCAAGLVAVYRLYNNGQGAAPNHRYTTSLATRTQMIGKGWVAEGYGDLGVIMCSPP
jgi:large repetitive protein